jgi:hypothetical protein
MESLITVEHRVDSDGCAYTLDDFIVDRSATGPGELGADSNFVVCSDFALLHTNLFNCR